MLINVNQPKGDSIRRGSLHPCPGWDFVEAFGREHADDQHRNESFWELELRNSPHMSLLGDRINGRRGCVTSNSTFPAVFESSRYYLQVFLIAMTSDVTFLS